MGIFYRDVGVGVLGDGVCGLGIIVLSMDLAPAVCDEFIGTDTGLSEENESFIAVGFILSLNYCLSGCRIVFSKPHRTHELNL